MGEDKFEPLILPTTHKITQLASYEKKNVIMAGNEQTLKSICSMLCTRNSCAGFSNPVNTIYACLLYSKVEFARANATDPALVVNEKLYMR